MVRIGHGAQGDEGNAALMRVARRAVRFHVHRQPAGFVEQSGLVLTAGDHFVDADQRADSRVRNFARQRFQPAGVAEESFAGDHLIGQDHVAGLVAGRDAAGYAEAHHRVDGARALQKLVGAFGAPAADDGERGGCGSRFLLEADDEGDAWGHETLRSSDVSQMCDARSRLSPILTWIWTSGRISGAWRGGVMLKASAICPREARGENAAPARRTRGREG